jgi:hypothetical protein
VLDDLLEYLILVPLLLLLLGLLLAFPVVLLAVSLAMDGGCLRVLLFGVGWLFSIFYGLIVGGLVGKGILGLDFVVTPVVQAFMWGYPLAGWWGHRQLQSLPREQRAAWKQTLTGGALLGFGAGSVAGLLRSAGSVGGGFGGVGGGSFGGGGASGSWSGASVGGSATGVQGSGAVVGTMGTAAAAVVAGGPSSLPPDATRLVPPPGGLWSRLRRWGRTFRWYHALSFALTTIVFLPLGLGTMTALQNRSVLLFALGAGAVYGAYRLIVRPGRRPRRLDASPTGGRASSTWR